jgi:hypothetical protein
MLLNSAIGHNAMIAAVEGAARLTPVAQESVAG